MAGTDQSKRRDATAHADAAEDGAADAVAIGARSRPLAPGLHLLATPIGAADDITLRGLDALRRADMLAAEDTRTLRRLLEIHGVALGGRPLVAYHDHSGDGARRRIVEALARGDSVVYASDAGTPLIADPGFKLAAAARDAGARVTALPGPCAPIAALTLSGLPTDRFSFGGFPPPKSGPRRRFLEAWRTTPGTLVFFETGRRLLDSLEDMRAVFGDRPAAVARELTKAFEEIRRGALCDLISAIDAKAPPKGEIVVVIGPATTPSAPDEGAIDAALRVALQTMSVKDASRTVAEHLAIGRKMVYERAVRLSETARPAAPSLDGDAAARDPSEEQNEP